MDIILYNIVACLASLIIGYFFGSIPTGVILCKAIFHADPRESGSKNSGGTNVGRLFGKKIGLATILLDALKTVLPMLLVWILINFAGIKDSYVAKFGSEMVDDGLLVIIFAPVGATIGHCWPIFAHFKGGKAVASYTGFAFSTCWLGFVGSFAAFFTTLKTTKFVSLSSMIGAAFSTLISWVLFIIKIVSKSDAVNFAFWGFGKYPLWAGSNIEYCIASTIVFLILIIRHIPNIKRLASKTESKIKWMK